MKNFLNILTIVSALIIVFLILMQGKGSGLGSAWGGSGEMYQTRRGFEKIIFRATIIFISIFFILSVINLFDL